MYATHILQCCLLFYAHQQSPKRPSAHAACFSSQPQHMHDVSVEHRVGKELSGPLVSTLVGLLFANTGVVSGSNAPAVYDTVNKFILPLAIPLLLFSADLRCALSH